MDEDWVLREQSSDMAYDLARSNMERCSTIACASDIIVAGQNMDLGKWTDGLQRLLQLKDCGDCGDVFVVMIGPLPTCGINSAGPGLCLNTVPISKIDPDGCPIAAIQFDVLHQRTLDDAAKIIVSSTPAAGIAFTVSSSQGILSYEATPLGISKTVSVESGWFARTNHALAANTHQTSLPATASSLYRYQNLKSNLGTEKRPLVDAIKSALSSTQGQEDGLAVSRELDKATGSIGFTSFSVVYSHGPDGEADLHVSNGPPSQNAYWKLGIRNGKPGLLEPVRPLST